jgi:HEAT repeat protein
MTDFDTMQAVVLAGFERKPEIARAALGHPDPACREVALGALDRLGVLDDAELTRALGDGDPGVRRRAVTIAARHHAVDITVLLDDPDVDVVETTAWAFGEREQVSDQVLAALIELAGGHSAPLVREAAVAALGAIGDARALDAIVAACSDKPAVRRRAVLALAPFDGPEADAALQRALTDRDWQVRQAAEDLLAAADGARVVTADHTTDHGT